ncbi:MAG: hypothetical protein AB1792_05945 [Candidatus Zixiibacteriota bacterium]
MTPHRVSGWLWIVGGILIQGLGVAGTVQGQEWPHRSALVFAVEGADFALSRETVAILAAAHAEMAAASGVALTDTVRVIYVGRGMSFDSVVGGRFPDWGVAAAVAERNLIAVRSPRDHPIGRDLASILRHELAHLHLDALVGLRQVPRWMQEGYAQQSAHQWQFGDDWVVARAAFSGHVIPLRDIDGVNSFRDASARLAYAESYLAMHLFLDSYGWEGLLLFAQRIRAGGTWDEAFFAATGADYAAYQREFHTFLSGKYNWASFLGDTVLLWIGLVIVFVILYLVKRRQSAARRADWERQEAREDVLYAPFQRPNAGEDIANHGP